MSPIVTSAAFGEGGYINCLGKLVASLNFFEINHVVHENSLPRGARPHAQSPYGFKVHAIELLKATGHDKILWLDATCIVEAPIEPLFARMAADALPVAAVYDDNMLDTHASDDSLNFFGRNRAELAHSRFVGGSMLAFDFRQRDAHTIFELWKQAEELGLFAGRDHDHRHDETCLALALYARGYEPCGHSYAGYDCGAGLCPPEAVIVTKHHFR